MNPAGSGAADLAFPRFSSLTFNAEGGGLPRAWRPYWPGGVSGVTLGPGYDLKERDTEEVRTQLVAAGVSASDADRLSAAAGLGAKAAGDWVERHRKSYRPITIDISMLLFLNVYPTYYGRARTKVEAWGASWDSLSPKMQEALIDLSFRGDFAQRHRKKLLPAIVTRSEAMLRDALADYDYWQSHTNLPPGKNGPNGRIVARAVFLGAAPPVRAPASGTKPVVPVGASPNGAGGAHAIVVPVSIQIAVLDSVTGQPVPYAAFDRLEIDGAPYQHPKLLRSKSGFAMTNAHGMLALPIESKVASRGFRLRLGLREAAVVAEASWAALETAPAERLVFREPLSSGVPSGLRGGLRPIWLGGQSTTADDPAWGWSARRAGVTAPDTSLPKFEKWLDWQVPATAASPGAWASIPRASRPFSIHHEHPGEAEIVLFALRFCPPIQQRPPSRARWVIAGSHGTLPQPISSLDPHAAMFMCTRYSAPPKVLSGGRDFGTFALSSPSNAAGTRVREDGTWKPHKGIDLAAADGVSPVFAVAYGRVRLNGQVGGYGRVVAQRIDSDGFHAIYAHLHDQPALPVGTTLRAGQLIGKAGRTESAEGVPAKSYPNNSPTHLHFEICHGTLSLHELRIEPSTWFAKHGLAVVPPPLPSNEMLRLFPCDCETPDGIAESCANRGGTSHAAAAECWAARSGVCPYVPV